MILIFAQADIADVPAEALKNYAIITACIIIIAAYARDLFGGKKRREISFEFEPASKEEFEEQKKHCTKRHGELFESIEEVKDGANQTVEQKIEIVRKDVIEVGKKVASLETSTQIQNQLLAEDPGGPKKTPTSMNPESKELFRRAILRVLDRNRSRYGLGIGAIGHALLEFSFSAATFQGDAQAFNDAIADALEYLTGKGFIEEALKALSAENRRWRITTGGIAFLDSGA